MTSHEQVLRMKLENMGAKYKFSYTYDSKIRSVTNAVILLGDRYFIATATCSKKDSFNKKIGRSIALGRAYQMLGLNSPTSVEYILSHLRFNEKGITTDAT